MLTFSNRGDYTEDSAFPACIEKLVDLGPNPPSQQSGLLSWDGAFRPRVGVPTSSFTYLHTLSDPLSIGLCDPRKKESPSF